MLFVQRTTVATTPIVTTVDDAAPAALTLSTDDGQIQRKCFNDLPNEMVDLIGKQLDKKSLYALALVDRRRNRIATRIKKSQPIFSFMRWNWRHVGQGRSTSYLFGNDMWLYQEILNHGGAPGVMSLSFRLDWDLAPASARQYPHARRAIERLLVECTNLRELSFSLPKSIGLGEFGIAALPSAPRLSSLTLPPGAMTRDEFTTFTAGVAPQLTHLSIATDEKWLAGENLDLSPFTSLRQLELRFPSLLPSTSINTLVSYLALPTFRPARLESVVLHLPEAISPRDKQLTPTSLKRSMVPHLVGRVRITLKLERRSIVLERDAKGFATDGQDLLSVQRFSVEV
ncbi:hypothetical protein JCM6882_009591 [Rhodosporidiobolus microsporus]